MYVTIDRRIGSSSSASPNAVNRSARRCHSRPQEQPALKFAVCFLWGCIDHIHARRVTDDRRDLHGTRTTRSANSKRPRPPLRRFTFSENPADSECPIWFKTERELEAEIMSIWRRKPLTGWTLESSFVQIGALVTAPNAKETRAPERTSGALQSQGLTAGSY